MSSFWRRVPRAMKKIGSRIDWLNLVIGAVIGVLITLPLEAGLERMWEALHKNEKALEEADKHRQLMTEQGFETARLKYQYVIDHAGLKHHLRVRAYQGMSRTYSEWAISRVVRGLSRKQYPDLAEKYAELAEKEAPSDLDTGLAVVYTYLAKEIGTPQHLHTEQKASQLLNKHPGNIELLDLAQNPSFFEAANPSTINNFLVLLNLWTYFARKAHNTSNAAERNGYISRAEDFLNAADQMNPDHELVLYRRGYSAQSLHNEWNKASGYYEAALRKQPEFPQASLNLATIYASWGQYSRAQEQFHEVISDEDVPVDSRAMALHNLGEVDLELKDVPGACDAWTKAVGLEDKTPMERLLSTVHSAMCKYMEQDFSSARKLYETAIALAEQQGLCLVDMSAYRDRWKVGARELEVAQGLNNLVKQNRCSPRPSSSNPVLVSTASH